jgi:beta-N-acetylhexosaminidase
MGKNMINWVENLLGKMNLEEKVGQLLVFGFCGPVITPDIVEFIKKHYVGGIRISQGLRILTLNNDFKPGEKIDDKTKESLVFPCGKNRDYSNRIPVIATAYEYASVYNQLREYALDTRLGIPIHFTIDQEGNASDDMTSGQRLFSHPMGIAATGESELAYKIGKAVGIQARAMGINMIQSLILDVNTNPNNPEIGTRAYSSNVDTVIRYAKETLRGYQEAGLYALGKHFPGRGDSDADAHWGLTTVKTNKNDMYNIHLLPYKEMFKAGLSAIMVGHSLYPSLGVMDKPASMSAFLLKDILRNELGFDGVICTDNMMMGSILKKYELADACVEAMLAGCDLILMRDESPMRSRVIEKMLDAVKEKRISEKELDKKVERILTMRYMMDLHKNGGLVDLKKFQDTPNCDFVKSVAVEAAKKSTLVLKNKNIPIRPEKRILLIEQVFPTHTQSNNMYSHPGLLWECMCQYSQNVNSIEIPILPTEDDYRRVMNRINEADIIVATNYYYHKYESDISGFLLEIQKAKLLIMVTNTPYKFGCPDGFNSIIITFNPGGRECLDMVARIIYGIEEPTARLDNIDPNWIHGVYCEQ